MNTTKPQRLVVKLGTAQLAGPDGKLNTVVFESVATQVAALRAEGVLTTVVSSGAIFACRQRLREDGIDASGFSKKLLAGIGAGNLLDHWRQAFKIQKLPVSQHLVTFYNCCHQDERYSLAVTLAEAMENGVIPIVNENDPVSPNEIELMDLGFSENDVLAALVADIIEADAIIFFSDAGGVFDGNPSVNTNVRRYLSIDAWNVPRELQATKDKVKAASVYGTGGIESKISAAARCHRSGMRVSIANLNGSKDILIRFVSGEAVGTVMGGSTILGD